MKIRLLAIFILFFVSSNILNIRVMGLNITPPEELRLEEDENKNTEDFVEEKNHTTDMENSIFVEDLVSDDTIHHDESDVKETEVIEESQNPNVLEEDLNNVSMVNPEDVSQEYADVLPVAESSEVKENIDNIQVIYTTHVQNMGWLDYRDAGKYSGAPDQNLRVEALIIESSEEIGLQYNVHIQDIGWQVMKNSGDIAGTTGASKRIEALSIDINSETKATHDILYSVYIEGFGWLDWAKNGANTGSIGIGKRIEAIAVKLVSKKDSANDNTRNLLLEERAVSYYGHIQNVGWRENSGENNMVGTLGKGLRLEALDFQNDYNDLFIEHKAHVSFLGWTAEKSEDEICGTVGKGFALEAIELKLSGKNSAFYEIFYRVHVQNIGWMHWTNNGSMAGTSGFQLRIEAIEIRIIPKGAGIINSNPASAKLTREETGIGYRAHVQELGWMGEVSGGAISGTVGKSKRLEAFSVNVKNNPWVTAKYSAYVAGIGWQDTAYDSKISGTVGQGRFIEAIKVELEGQFSDYYSIYYRVHVSEIGWLDWSTDGKPNGTKGYNCQVEAMEIMILPKTSYFAGSVSNPYKENTERLAKKSMVYYTTGQTSIYVTASTSNPILDIPKGCFLIGNEVNSVWFKTEFNSIEGYVRNVDISGHTVTLAGKTIIVNKRNGLPASFSPGINHEANVALNNMISDASKAGIRLNMFSSYRSYSYQNTLFDRYVAQDGRYNAERYSMRPGYSEHQTGLSFDIGGSDSSQWTKASFGKTREGVWMRNNALKYGFILRYPEGKEHITGIIYEPWHFRYVGKELAKEITNSGKTFDEYYNVVAINY